jgi:hypothetical protein
MKLLNFSRKFFLIRISIIKFLRHFGLTSVKYPSPLYLTAAMEAKTPTRDIVLGWLIYLTRKGGERGESN